MIWGAMNSKHLFGPYLFDRPVNHLNYLAMLENWCLPQLQSLEIKSNEWFQQDGPAHFAVTVREYLNEVFPNCWIGHGSVTLPAPLDWLPQSPDLTTCDNSLKLFFKFFKKEKIALQHYMNTDELKQAVTDALNEVTPQMLKGECLTKLGVKSTCVVAMMEHKQIQ